MMRDGSAMTKSPSQGGSALHVLSAAVDTGLTAVAVVPVHHSSFDCESATAWLGADEQARARRFRFQRARDSFVGAHALWAVAVQTVLGLRPADWRLMAAAPGGKPVLE